MDAGYLAEGGPADLILFDEKGVVEGEHFLLQISNTPFRDWEMKGKDCYTICAGKDRLSYLIPDGRPGD